MKSIGEVQLVRAQNDAPITGAFIFREIYMELYERNNPIFDIERTENHGY